MKLIFSTANLHKLEEVQQMMPRGVTLITPAQIGITEEIPENEPTLEGNATAKSRYIYDRTGCDCFADDTGLEVEALGGEPGVHSARYATDGHDFEANIDLLLLKLEKQANCRARFRTVISLIENGVERQFEGMVEGVITPERSGSGGFGYDSVFQADGYDVTFAQMDLDEKNAISHRGRAVAKLVEYLSQKLK